MSSSYSSWDDWFNVFYEELDTIHTYTVWPYAKSWPALLGFHNLATNKYHAVVVDGYRTSPSNQVHVNMGWDGGSDGYYSMSNVLGYADATYDHAVIGIRPQSGFPTVAIKSPKDGESVHGEHYTLGCEASDDFGITKLDLFIDGNKFEGTNIPGFFGYYDWDTMKTSNGKHSLKAIAYDEEGKASDPHEISVYVKNVAVTLEATRKIESAWLVRGHYADISFTASNEGYSIYKYEIYRKEGSGEYQLIKTFDEYPSPLAFSMSYTDKYLKKDLSYTYLIKAHDKGGLCGKSEEKTI